MKLLITQFNPFFSNPFFLNNTLPAGYLSRPLGRQEIRRYFISLATMVLPLLWGAGLQAASCTWLGGTGNWSDASKWSCGVVPGPGDEVIISSGTVTMDVPATVVQLVFAGVELTGSNTLTVSGAVSWNNGNINAPLHLSGTCIMDIDGGNNLGNVLNIGAGAVVNQLAPFSIQSGGGVVNDGSYVQDSGNLQMNNNSVTFDNNGTFEVHHDGTALGGGGTFTNNGVFEKVAGVGDMLITPVFINNGTFNHTSGNVVRFYWLTQNGTFNLNAGGTLRLTGRLNAPIAFPAGTTLQWDNGSLENNTALVIDGTFEIPSGGTMSGTGDITINGTMNWASNTINQQITIGNSGEMNITGSTSLGADLINNGIVNQGGSLSYGAHTITNNGTYNKTGGNLQLNSSSAVFDNNGTFNASHDGTLMNGSGTFNNNGVFEKVAGVGDMLITPVFINNGTFNHTSGNVVTFYWLTQNGTFNLNAGGTLRLTGRLNAPIAFPAGTTLQWDNGNLENNTALVIDGTFEIPSGGTMSGTGDITINGTMNWASNTINQQITIGNSGELNMTGPFEKKLNSDLLNDGTVNHSGSGNFFCSGSITNNNVYNKTGGILQLNSSSTVFDNNGTFNLSQDGSVIGGPLSAVFNNDGTFIKTTSGISSINPTFINNGTIQGFGTLDFTSFIQNGTFSPGLSPGILTIDQPAAILQNTSTVNIEIFDNSGPGTGHDQLLFTGGVTLDGTLTVTETGTVSDASFV
ncbi:MAG TPA: hypothetical protein ENJ95_23935, partial [Bacteroidetes bacterium]|nr:hypothetical protein [Bacteroidota bacterium]